MAERIPLADLLATVGDELQKANQRARRFGATMEFSECELEFAVEAEKGASGGVHVWLLDFKGGGKRTDSNTIRIKFKSIQGKSIQAEQGADKKKGPSLKKQ